GAPDLIPRAVMVNVVHLVEVDEVGLQSLQASFAVPMYFYRGQVAAVPVRLRGRPRIVDWIEDLGGKHDALPPRASLRQPPADNILGMSPAHGPPVCVRGVEEVDAKLQRPVHDREAVLLTRVPAEIHRPQADIAHERTMFSEPAMGNSH